MFGRERNELCLMGPGHLRRGDTRWAVWLSPGEPLPLHVAVPLRCGLQENLLDPNPQASRTPGRQQRGGQLLREASILCAPNLWFFSSHLILTLTSAEGMPTIVVLQMGKPRHREAN